MKEEKIMALIDWDGEFPYLITVCRQTSQGLVIVAFEVVQGDIEPHEAFLNGADTPISFDDVDETTLQRLYTAANKALQQSVCQTETQQVAAN